MKRIATTAIILAAGSLAAQAQSVFEYDFNSQWSGWTLNDPSAISGGFNYSKQEEGRSGGAGGNYLGGNVQITPGGVGSVTWVNNSAGAFDLTSAGSSLRIQQSWSAFANQPAFAAGSSEPGQIGILNGTAGTLKTGDSLYIGVIERSWDGQNLVAPFPGEAEVEIGLFQDGNLIDSFGTYTIPEYGARVGSEIWAQWLEFDIYFENMGASGFGYKVAAQRVPYYNSVIDGNDSSIVEGTPVMLFTEQGILSGGSGLAALNDLRVGLGATIAPGGDVSVSGATYDHSPAGDLHDGIIAPVPEPGAAVLGLLGSALLLRRRRR